MPGATSPSVRPTVMIYVQHLLGIGHLMRARHLGEALVDRGFGVTLVSGGMPIGGRPPRGVDVVQLSPIRVADASFNPLRDPEFTPLDDAYRDRRRDELLAAFAAAAPDVVLFETFPFGRRALRFELFPLLERIDATTPRPLVLASIREILQVQAKPERDAEAAQWANRWFDAVLVHGDARFARLEESFPLTADLRPAIHYTGFVLDGELPEPAPGGERREVVVSAGGGGVGVELLATALEAQRASTLRDLTWRVLAGPNVPAAGMERLLRAAGPRAIVERARVDFPALLRGACVSVSQAGYNTTLDVLMSGARPVLVPFTGRGETEQAARAKRLGALDLAIVVDDRMLGPETLARAVDAAAARTAWGRWDFDTDGAARTADIIADMVSLPAARARAHTGTGRRAPQPAPVAPGGARYDAAPWDALARELDAWAAAGRCATLWCRDDDACRATAALERLLAVIGPARIPLALATIPAALDLSLADVVAAHPLVTVVQHGYAHRNHAPVGERSCELGVHRGLRACVDELGRGREVLAETFGGRFLPVLVPPWNRIHPDVVAALPDAGLAGLSTFGPRPRRAAAAGLVQCNTHVDLIAWRSGRTFIGAARAVGRLVEHLAARRAHAVDATEPTGLLTHHLDSGPEAWAFLEVLFGRTREHPGAQWLDARSAFAFAAAEAFPVTSGR